MENGVIVNYQQRRHVRKRYHAEVVFVFGDRLNRGTIVDISLGGAFIITPNVNLYSAGDIITISIPFPNGQSSVKRKAQVRWLNSEGIAIEFLFTAVM
ncbi:MAG: PilZ domain-containing protein [Desulfatitalea sp.]|nr:PilZ domain-containing protein [Desulfatitalea sp.]NNK00353.1 PilZ domain-containing protein [Desulfatitalea sp.]